MSQSINRRNWIKSSFLLAGGLAAAPTLAYSRQVPVSRFQPPRVDWEMPPGAEELKARLMANENPYGPSPAAQKAVIEAVSQGNRYPFLELEAFMEELMEKEQVKAEQLLPSPGSSDILHKAAIAFCKDGGEILSADPAYMNLVEVAQAVGAKWKAVPLRADYAHDLPAMEAAINDKTRLVYICNPNNPTGSITPTAELRDFCARVSERVPIFVDEAYLDFLDESHTHSMVDLVRQGKPIIVARTFSKIYGLAGMRIGYGISQPEILERLKALGWSMMGINTTAVAAARASLKDADFPLSCRDLIRASRERVCEALAAMEFDYIPSHTNFVLFQIRMRSEQMQEKMWAEGVGIRTFDIRRRPYCRVSIGTDDEIEIFIQTLQKVAG